MLFMSKTVVITGASSGIGEATAYELARQGMQLVLAARNDMELNRVAAVCRHYGAEVLVVPTDVAVEEDVNVLASEAVQRFGSIDVWINNAGVTMLGKFVDTDSVNFRKVMETNFFGVVYGSRAALRSFYPQQQGTLINVSSVLGAIPDPYESAYVASKFAIKGFTASIRQEAYIDGMKDIHVCTLMPATIDTPIYRNAANITGKQALPIWPMNSPEMVARKISRLLDVPRSELVAGGTGSLFVRSYHLLPRLSEGLFARYIEALHFKDKKAARTTGNLYEPSKVHSVHGNWKIVPKAVKVTLMVAVGAGMVLAMRRMKEENSYE
jgi:short-subunit dehydrogenase